MASKKLQGIIIEIAGNTTKLTNSLKDVNSKIASTSKELKNINSLLKLDPTNTVLLAQKQQVLADTIKNTADKLAQLKDLKKQADDNDSIDKNSQAYRELEREIIATEGKLGTLTKQFDENGKEINEGTGAVKDFKDAEDKAGASALKLGDLIKANLISDAIKKGLSALADSMKAIGKAAIDMGKQAVENYAEYEQLVGGVDTLFKESSKQVQQYAANAYKTAGMSANEYMETVTSFSASLLQSLGGDTQKSAEVADMALTDMADNANKMGTSMESIQNAYQGFAKQNYTMLD